MSAAVDPLKVDALGWRYVSSPHLREKLGSGLVCGSAGSPSGSLDRFLTRLLGSRPSLASLANFVEFFVGEVLNADERILRCAHPNEFIQLDLDRGAISILRILYEKNHQKRDDRSPRVYDELPSIGIIEDRAGYCPYNYHQSGHKERSRSSGSLRRAVSNFAKGVGESPGTSLPVASNLAHGRGPQSLHLRDFDNWQTGAEFRRRNLATCVSLGHHFRQPTHKYLMPPNPIFNDGSFTLSG
jgi:hypothetical protein